MKTVIKNGLLGQLNTMRIFLSEYKDDLKGGILTENEYIGLRSNVAHIYERLMREDICNKIKSEGRLVLGENK